MKTAARIVLLLAILLAGTAPGRSAASHPERSRRSSGPMYVGLDTWARANEFHIQWLGEKSLQLGSHQTRLMFVINSREARINGVTIWLSFPISYSNGRVLISQSDLDKTLGPLLFPPSNKPGIIIKTICLDPGHGGKDPGFRVGSREEQKYTLLLAQELREQLTQAGFKVVLTRTTDAFVDLESRAEQAHRRSADLFVSLHFNATENGRNEVNGSEVYCLTPAGATSFNAHGEGDTRWVSANRNDEKNMQLAYQVQKSLVARLQAEDRGVKRARYAVLRDATMPAVLIEGGFMSHPVEGRKILDAAYRREMARAIVDGILAYKRIVKG
jgi:N-acetylmuramoyl-L-alanine amidase